MPRTQVSRSAEILEADPPPPYEEAPPGPPQLTRGDLSSSFSQLSTSSSNSNEPLRAIDRLIPPEPTSRSRSLSQLSSNNPWVSASRNSDGPIRPIDHLIPPYPSSNPSRPRADSQLSTSSRDSYRPEALINRLIPPEQTPQSIARQAEGQKNAQITGERDHSLSHSRNSQPLISEPLRDLAAPPEYSTPLPSPAPGYSPFIFPKAFGFYHASGSFSNLVVALSSSNSRSQPQFYISTHGSFSSQPDVILHSSPRDSSPPLATADFHSFSSTIDLSIHIGTTRVTSTLKKKESFSNTYTFTLPIDVSRNEVFEWKKSHGNEVRSLNGGHRGMKLVRVKDGKIVVAWTTPNAGTHKKAKMEFLGGIAVVISVLGLMESGRRKNNSGAMGATVAGGAAC
ncbi:hypothetical protein B0J14DRAFT_592644 [Halenospora varia]|nr:hypothetical protein B0J14DRAFT_592644 [Halenospora varia]